MRVHPLDREAPEGSIHVFIYIGSALKFSSAFGRIFTVAETAGIGARPAPHLGGSFVRSARGPCASYFPSGQGDPSGIGSGLNSTATGFDPGHRQQPPDRASGVSLSPSNRTRLNWYNTGAFTCPGYSGWLPGTPCTTGSGSGSVPLPIGRFGNAPVGSVVGPGTENFSVGLLKSTKLTEGTDFLLGIQVANLFNRRNYEPPSMQVDAGGFGQISALQTAEGAGPRTAQITARITF